MEGIQKSLEKNHADTLTGKNLDQKTIEKLKELLEIVRRKMEPLEIKNEIGVLRISVAENNIVIDFCSDYFNIKKMVRLAEVPFEIPTHSLESLMRLKEPRKILMASIQEEEKDVEIE